MSMMRALVLFIFSVILLIISASVSAYISILGIKRIPVESYAVKALIVLILFEIFTFLAFWNGLRALFNDFIRGVLYWRFIYFGFGFLSVVVVISIVTFIRKPDILAWCYNQYCVHTSDSVCEGDDACLSIMEAINGDRNNPSYLYAGGKTFFLAGNYDKAILLLSRAVKNSEINAEYYYLLGRAYLHSDSVDDYMSNPTDYPNGNDLINAERSFLIAVGEEPDNPEYSFSIAMVYYYMLEQDKEYDKAYDKGLMYFEKAIDGCKSEPRYFYCRGRLKYVKDPQNAIDDLKHAADERSYMADYKYWLGRSYFATDMFEEAAQCFDSAKSLDNTNDDYQVFSELANSKLGWGNPDNIRPSYTNKELTAGVLGDSVVLNSASDDDEIRFISMRDANDPNAEWNKKNIDVVDGETYTIRLRVHNNNPKGYEALAKDVESVFSLPTTVAKSHPVIGYLECSNSQPARCWDCITLNSDEYFFIEYVKGSARYSNNNGEFEIPNDVIFNYTKLGYDDMNGILPGGEKYAGYLMIDVKVHKSVAAKLSLQGRLKGTTEWEEAVYANIGDEIEYQIEYVNLLSDAVSNVIIRDVLPSNVEYVEGSTVLYNSSHKEGIVLVSDSITTNGINIGDYKPRGNAFIRFTGRVIDKSLAVGYNQLVNWASVTIYKGDEVLLYKDDASVMVKRN